MKWIDLDGRIQESAISGASPMDPCGSCGMRTGDAEYHPHAACLMFEASRDSGVVRANLVAIVEFGGRRVIAAERLCEVYFDLAAGAIGEEKVRLLRDARLEELGP